MANKDFGNLIIEGKYERHALGTLIILDLKENKLCNEDWIVSVPLKIGDTFTANELHFEILKIECARNLMDSKIRQRIGLVVKECNKKLTTSALGKPEQ